ncbi:MAG TPA: branched-chain amino acid ABC transporter permease [Stellaceae bacterium]|nr:branched-chain amino acid ABC transporter permease [Stellaceae bacterium]
MRDACRTGSRPLLCRHFLLFGLAALILLGGCTRSPDRVQLCRQAAFGLLELSPSAASARLDSGGWAWLDPNLVRLDIVESPDDAIHHVSCRFSEPKVAGDLPGLGAMTIDGVSLPPIRLAMTAIALGMPPALAPQPSGAAQDASIAGAYLAQQLINGLVMGAILALVAAGYSLVYALTGIMQLAYGQVLTLGAFMLILLTSVAASAGLPGGLPALVPAALAAILCTGLLGIAIQRTVYQPLEDGGGGQAPADTYRLMPLIAGIGLGITLESLMRVTQGPGDLWLARMFAGRRTLWDAHGFTVVIGDNQIVILALSLALGVVVSLTVTRSHLGRIYRAASDNPGMAALLGVNTKALTRWTVAAGAGLAGVSGLAITLDYGEVDAGMGFLFGFQALTAALIGGLGSLRGAVAGGFVLGLAEALWVAYMDAAYRDAMVFALLCLALVFRPEGLFRALSLRPPDEQQHRQF